MMTSDTPAPTCERCKDKRELMYAPGHMMPCPDCAPTEAPAPAAPSVEEAARDWYMRWLMDKRGYDEGLAQFVSRDGGTAGEEFYAGFAAARVPGGTPSASQPEESVPGVDESESAERSVR